jgi:hypothetical protein
MFASVLWCGAVYFEMPVMSKRNCRSAVHQIKYCFLNRHCCSKVRESYPWASINYAPSHEDVWGSEDIAPPFLTLALDGGEWSASNPCCFIASERALSTHCIGAAWAPEKVRMLWRTENLLPVPALELLTPWRSSP